MRNFNVILYPEFETLDALGPVEVIGELPDYYRINCYSSYGGLIKSSQNINVDTLPISLIEGNGVLLIPGGQGARKLVKDVSFIEMLKELAARSEYVLSVCTGSALLAQTGLLDDKNATSNKAVFDWVVSIGKHVKWIKHARWIVDDQYYTSSGVSAGMDMILGFVSDIHGKERAEMVAKSIEYLWNSDMDHDPFSSIVE